MIMMTSNFGVSSRRRNLQVVVVDDSTALRERITTMLSEMPGVDIAGEAADVGEAIKVIRARKPDVVLLDIHMPGGSGIDVLHAVKRELPATIVIMFTNYAFPSYRTACEKAGADHYFDKFTEHDRMLATVGELTRRRITGQP